LSSDVPDSVALGTALFDTVVAVATTVPRA
jgi:hypothetical protein